MNDSFCHGRNKLNLDSLCVDKMKLRNLCADNLKSKDLKSERITANEVCAQDVKSRFLKSEDAQANNLCVSGRVTAGSVWSNSSISNNLCAKDATFDNACITNLRATNFEQCNTFRATSNFAENQVYELGTLLNFSNIVDDPNGNLQVAPTRYTAPKDGYYMVTFKANASNVQSADPVLGIPVANAVILVNDEVAREAYLPFISFFSEQKSLVSSLITLRMGDVVTLRYDVLRGNGDPVVGTVDIIGAGIEDGNSLFKIIFLSSLCENGDQPIQCAPCPSVSVPCAPFMNPCLPVQVDCNRDCNEPSNCHENNL